MNSFLFVPDSFKGNMPSAQVCGIMERVVLRHFPKAIVKSIPVADGGEGTVDCFLTALGGEKVTLPVKGPLFEEMEGFYGMLPNGVAVVEMAACAGLPLVKNHKNPLPTTTFGVGQLLLHAAQNGAHKVVLGLGGSCTNDGGCGAAAAAGVRFLDAEGREFVPVGQTLSQIARIDKTGLSPLLQKVEVIAMCDIDNPLFGQNGAAYVFGPQKGASPEEIPLLDEGLRHLAKVMQRDLGEDLSALKGGGAAGGMGAGAAAFLNARLQMGIRTVLDVLQFDNMVSTADIVFTGEGRIDEQSLRGKVVIGVARRAKKAGVPVVAFVGDIRDPVQAAYGEGVTAIFSINRLAVPREQAKSRAAGDLELTVDNFVRFLKMMKL